MTNKSSTAILIPQNDLHWEFSRSHSCLSR
uniref:Uncharacterized protein n=1 Tax=Arundo donax TaxID=35708 RepID=A0A0A9CHJ4_ARUDO